MSYCRWLCLENLQVPWVLTCTCCHLNPKDFFIESSCKVVRPLALIWPQINILLTMPGTYFKVITHLLNVFYILCNVVLFVINLLIEHNKSLLNDFLSTVIYNMIVNVSTKLLHIVGHWPKKWAAIHLPTWPQWSNAYPRYRICLSLKKFTVKMNLKFKKEQKMMKKI